MILSLHVLIVEDDPINQRVTQKMLRNLGCTWSVVENGLAALAALREAGAAFDLVLMDLHMPELDGVSATARIRAGEAGDQCRGIWIAAFTADARPEQKKRTLAAGANDYLIKPVSVAQLEDGLRRYANERIGGAKQVFPFPAPGL